MAEGDMLARRVTRNFVVIAGIYLLLWVPAIFSTGYLDSPFGLVAAIPVLSIYMFNMVGIPGLLKSGGACGWGWCAPTPFGWAFVVVVWLLIAWLLAWVIALTFPATRKDSD